MGNNSLLWNLTDQFLVFNPPIPPLLRKKLPLNVRPSPLNLLVGRELDRSVRYSDEC